MSAQVTAKGRTRPAMKMASWTAREEVRMRLMGRMGGGGAYGVTRPTASLSQRFEFRDAVEGVPTKVQSKQAPPNTPNMIPCCFIRNARPNSRPLAKCNGG